MSEVAKNIVDKLAQQGLWLSVAESCTGGKIAAEIVGVSGASDVFFEGIVTYSNKSKQLRLGVLETTLNEVGAVSEEVATQMLLGQSAHADAAISTTGIAGPGGGTAEKPVGLVYIGTMFKDKVRVTKNMFLGNREQIREQAKETALKQMLTLINE